MIERLVSHAELQRMANMSMQERVNDIMQSTGRRICPSTLYRVYQQNEVRYRTVDLHSTCKIKKAAEIQRKQQEFVIKLRSLWAQRKIVFFIDETSTHAWEQRKRTFTRGATYLHYQERRGHSRTVFGAVGGELDISVHWVYSVEDNTSSETVKRFLNKLITL